MVKLEKPKIPLATSGHQNETPVGGVHASQKMLTGRRGPPIYDNYQYASPQE